MKTIRPNTFETNSSSTHSITIVNLAKHKEKPHYRSIVENNVLYPANLSHSIACSKLEFGDGGHHLKCTDKYTKAALVVHWINSYVSYADVRDNDRFKFFLIIRDRLVLDSIYSPDEATEFEYDTESLNSDVFRTVFDAEDTIAAMNNFVTDVILNDDIIIIDENIPY